MTLRRFINAEGWEKWVDVPDPPPRAWAMHDAPPPPDPELSRVERMQAAMTATTRSRLFLLTQWRPEGCARNEDCYVEQGHTPAAEHFGAHRPSLHRERVVAEPYVDLLRRLREIVDSANEQGHAFFELLEAHEALRKIDAELRAHEGGEKSSGVVVTAP